jgi:hypothetical protein
MSATAADIGDTGAQYVTDGVDWVTTIRDGCDSVSARCAHFSH